MSDKWIVILIGSICITMFAPLAIMEYGKNQCRIEAIKAGMDADKIKTACGIQ